MCSKLPHSQMASRHQPSPIVSVLSPLQFPQEGHPPSFTSIQKSYPSSASLTPLSALQSAGVRVSRYLFFTVVHVSLESSHRQITQIFVCSGESVDTAPSPPVSALFGGIKSQTKSSSLSNCVSKQLPVALNGNSLGVWQQSIRIDITPSALVNVVLVGRHVQACYPNEPQ